MQITVDGDTSTNDTVLALASGAAGNAPITNATAPAAQQLEAALTATLQGMAKAIAWDGEGATCLLEIKCTGAQSEADGQLVAKSVASSSLTKAAVFGHDPNWGRIACAAGYSGTPGLLDGITCALHAHVSRRPRPCHLNREAHRWQLAMHRKIPVSLLHATQVSCLAACCTG